MENVCYIHNPLNLNNKISEMESCSMYTFHNLAPNSQILRMLCETDSIREMDMCTDYGRVERYTDNDKPQW